MDISNDLLEYSHNESNETLMHDEFDLDTKVTFWLYVFIIPLINLPGCIVCILSVTIFCRKRMLTSLNVYLAGVFILYTTTTNVSAMSCMDAILLASGLLLYPLVSLCGGYNLLCRPLQLTSLIVYPVSLMAQVCKCLYKSENKVYMLRHRLYGHVLQLQSTDT
jgi:hypothetical protein